MLEAIFVVTLSFLLVLTANPLAVALIFSIGAGLCTFHIIPLLTPAFIRAGVAGKDLLKPHQPTLPESMGLVAAFVYFLTMFVFLPVPFLPWMPLVSWPWWGVTPASQAVTAHVLFPHDKLGQVCSALLTLLSMTLMGFVDDVLDIPWRIKLFLPGIASIPLLTVYYVEGGSTTVMLPFSAGIVDLGIIYYFYMILMSIFCTNAINILAGVNGLEVGQSWVIAVSIALNNFWMVVKTANTATLDVHLFSLYLLLPFIGVTTALLLHNWFPAKVFVGDTFCYFAGMTLAVVGILGHFSKTVLLFFLPQLFNFALSLPQLFHLVDCPRHRMPRLEKDERLSPSVTIFTKQERKLAVWTVKILARLKLIRILERNAAGQPSKLTNFTLINSVLLWRGPLREEELVRTMMGLQVVGSVVALFIRHMLV